MRKTTNLPFLPHVLHGGKYGWFFAIPLGFRGGWQQETGTAAMLLSAKAKFIACLSGMLLHLQRTFLRFVALGLVFPTTHFFK